MTPTHFPKFWNSAKRVKLLLRLHVDIDKPAVACMTLPGRWYIWGPAKIRSPHISVLYILCEVKFKFECLQLN